MQKLPAGVIALLGCLVWIRGKGAIIKNQGVIPFAAQKRQ